MPQLEIKRITITGGRQSGKTTRVIEKMIEHAQAGLRVAYVTGRGREGVEAQRRIESIAPTGMVKSVRAHGQERIRFSDGGEILFITGSKNAGRGFVFDVVVFDGFQPPDEIRCNFESTLLGSQSPWLYDVFVGPTADGRVTCENAPTGAGRRRTPTGTPV